MINNHKPEGSKLQKPTLTPLNALEETYTLTQFSGVALGLQAQPNPCSRADSCLLPVCLGVSSVPLFLFGPSVTHCDLILIIDEKTCLQIRSLPQVPDELECVCGGGGEREHCLT